MPSRRVSAVLLSIALLAGCQGTLPATRSSAELRDLQEVVEVFRNSIIKKDKAAFSNLFFSNKPELVTWQAVVDDPSLATIKSTRPEAVKARHRPDNNFVAFIDGIVASKDAEEETFSDVQIDTDGEIASISFDYVYLSKSKPTNNGREKWLLVRTEQGWKIVSVVYTIRLPRRASGAHVRPAHATAPGREERRCSADSNIPGCLAAWLDGHHTKTSRQEAHR
jgi:hypothetical protein